MQLWKVIKDYPNYSVSNLGNVKNNKTGKLLKPSDDGRGYLQVRLYFDGVGKPIKVHKLVFEAFKYKVPKGKVLNHIDSNKYNNCIRNLECVSQYDNVIHAITNGNFNMRPVYCYETGKEYPSIADASRELNIDIANAQKVCSGKYKQTKGFHLVYLEEK